jgi:hypothetical protein
MIFVSSVIKIVQSNKMHTVRIHFLLIENIFGDKILTSEINCNCSLYY